MQWLSEHWYMLSPFIAGVMAWLGRQKLGEWRRTLHEFRQSFRDASGLRRQLADCTYNKEQAERNLAIVRATATNLADAMEALTRQGEAMRAALPIQKTANSSDVPQTSSAGPLG